jgi:hypothetical protein
MEVTMFMSIQNIIIIKNLKVIPNPFVVASITVLPCVLEVSTIKTSQKPCRFGNGLKTLISSSNENSVCPDT